MEGSQGKRKQTMDTLKIQREMERAGIPDYWNPLKGMFFTGSDPYEGQTVTAAKKKAILKYLRQFKRVSTHKVRLVAKIKAAEAKIKQQEVAGSLVKSRLRGRPKKVVPPKKQPKKKTPKKKAKVVAPKKVAVQTKKVTPMMPIYHF
jgi:hypothetical protein